MNTGSIRIDSSSVDETMALGRRIGSTLSPGDVVTLGGDLGAGKTMLAKGIAGGLGYAYEAEVTSPTFVLMQRYACPSFVICHVDAYRLGSGWDLVELGGDELFSSSAVTLVEWPERVDDVLDMPHLRIEIEAGDGDRRVLRIRGAAGMSRARLDRLERVLTGPPSPGTPESSSARH